MRILCFDHEGGFGGSSRSLFSLIASMDRGELDIEVWCRKSGPIVDQYQALDIPTQTVPELPTAAALYRLSRNFYTFGKVYLELATSKKLRHRLVDALDSDPDLIHFNNPNFAMLASHLRKRTDIPFCMHMRTSLENTYEGTSDPPLIRQLNQSSNARIAAWQTRQISSSVNHCVFITKAEEKSFRKLGGKTPGTVIHNAADPIAEILDGDSRIPDDDRIRIAAVENYRWSRGTDRLVEIAESLSRRGNQSILFVVAGNMKLPRSQLNLPGDADERSDDLKSYVTNLGLENYFCFLGSVPKPESVISKCDAVISIPRRTGPWGRNVIEAMTLGKPVIATGDGPGFVRNGENGFFLQNFDPEIFADLLENVVGKRGDLAVLGENARTFIAEKCDGAARAADLKAVWTGLAKK
ncbi:MAG TPA: hypothetical protein DCE33_03595 [Rhodospirillaceae bacterium]|nr:hypothetical protein [Rhodospirillaceae bacterium]